MTRFVKVLAHYPVIKKKSRSSGLRVNGSADAKSLGWRGEELHAYINTKITVPNIYNWQTPSPKKIL